VDSGGMITSARVNLDDYKNELAWPAEMAAAAGISPDDQSDLARLIVAYKATVLIGTSGQANSFNENVVKAMAANTEQPVILPMSNPTSICEGSPADILAWTDGKALVATGSPFEPVDTPTGPRRIGQANNVFVFPGIGLGAIVSNATEITTTMIAASSRALAEALGEDEIKDGCLMPEVSRLWDVCGLVALAVARQAIEDGVAQFTDASALPDRIAAYRWLPEYPEIVITDS